MKKWLELKQNPALFKKHFIREAVIHQTRNFFLQRGFHEVETPILKKSLIPESYLEVFETRLLDRYKKASKMFLSTSPEASIKKLLVGGIGNCFEIAKAFRNTESGNLYHQPEFTILEWYRIDANYKDLMKDCQDLLVFLSKKIFKSKKSLVYQGKKIDLSSPWQRLSVTAAFKKYAKIDLSKCLDKQSIAKVAKLKGYKISSKDSWEQIYNQIFLNEVELYLGTNGHPTIIFDYPAHLAALAQLKQSDHRFAERFEFYIGGLELGDCYTELTDYDEQKMRFNKELKLREELDKTKIKPDYDFLEALKIGLPPSSGIAVGLDRLAMLFSDAKSIDEILYFPL